MRMQLILLFLSFVSFNSYSQTIKTYTSCIEYNLLNNYKVNELNVIFINNLYKDVYSSTVFKIIFEDPSEKDIALIEKSFTKEDISCVRQANTKKVDVYVDASKDIILNTSRGNIEYKNNKVYLNKKDITSNSLRSLIIKPNKEIYQRKYIFECIYHGINGIKNLCTKDSVWGERGYIECPFYNKDFTFAPACSLKNNY